MLPGTKRAERRERPSWRGRTRRGHKICPRLHRLRISVIESRNVHGHADRLRSAAGGANMLALEYALAT